jgi:hypothetical protein
MNDELNECYNLLGLRPGASSAELKAAHRDLTKVWHPDRFLHDVRLQEKAQEKLKQINEAYDRLRSGKPKPTPSSNRERPTGWPTQTVNVRKAQKIRWQLILVPVLIFLVAFLVTSRSLRRTARLTDQGLTPASDQATAPDGSPEPERQQPGSLVSDSANELSRGKDRVETRSQSVESDGASTSHPDPALLRPLSTVTVVIDPTTGLLARSGCPIKTRVTYPTGNEPHEYCTSHAAAPNYEAPGPGELRVKSAVRRLASPDKWFGSKTNSNAGTKQDSKSP